MEITHINQAKYVWQARQQMAMNILNSRSHFIAYMTWTEIISASYNSTKFALIRIIDAGSLTSMVYLIYVKLRMCLSALLNQGHNQQSAKNAFTFCK